MRSPQTSRRAGGLRAGLLAVRLLLFVTAVVLWSGASLLWWTEERLLDEPQFVQTVSEALRQDAAREAIADQTWEEMRAQFPFLDLVNSARAEATIADLLASPRWTPLFRDSARDAYLSALSDEMIPVTFNLANDYPRLLEALLPFDPQIFGELRPIPALGSIVLLPADDIPPLGRWLPVPGWWPAALWVTGFLALVGVVTARPRPWFALAVLGGAGGAAGLLLVTLTPWLGDRAMEDAGNVIAVIVTQALVAPWQDSLHDLGVRLTLGGAAVAAAGLLAFAAARFAAWLRLNRRFSL